MNNIKVILGTTTVILERAQSRLYFKEIIVEGPEKETIYKSAVDYYLASKSNANMYNRIAWFVQEDIYFNLLTDEEIISLISDIIPNKFDTGIWILWPDSNTYAFYQAISKQHADAWVKFYKLQYKGEKVTIVASVDKPSVMDGFIGIDEAWVASGGNPEIHPTKQDLIHSLKLMDEVIDEIDDNYISIEQIKNALGYVTKLEGNNTLAQQMLKDIRDLVVFKRNALILHDDPSVLGLS